MLSKLLVISLFSDAYSGIVHPPAVSHYNCSDGNYYVFQSSFRSISFNTDGGAISMTPYVSVRILIEESLFDKCSSLTSGGGVFISSTLGSIFLKKVCGYDCWSTANQFGFFLSGLTKPNVCQLVSITKCASQALSRTAAVYFQNGIQNHTSTNSSNNQLTSYSGCYSNVAAQLNWEFSTIVNNYAHTSVCLYFVSSATSVSYQIFNSNFVSNNSPSLSVLCYDRAILYIRSSFFNDNSGFLLGNNAYTTSSYLYNCYLFHNANSVSVAAVTLSNSTIRTTSGSTLSIGHFATYMCYNKDIIDILNENNAMKSPAQTIPPPPTDCFLESSPNSVLHINSVLSFLYISSVYLSMNIE